MKFIKKFLQYITLQQREKRYFVRYNQNRKRLEKLPDKELHARYTYLKITFEYRKQVFLFITAGFFVSVISGMWKLFFAYIKKSLELYLGQVNTMEESQLIWGLSSFFIIVCTVLLFLSVTVYLKNTYSIYKELLIIDEINRIKNFTI